jgi:hypothetical protein
VSESLRAYLAARGLDERLVMNELQDHGVISDNAVSVADVGNGGVAIAWLEKRDQRALRARDEVRRAA